MLHLFFSFFVPSITGSPRIILLVQYIQTVTTRNTTHCTYTSRCHTPRRAMQSYGPLVVGCDNPGRGVSHGFPGLLLLLKRPRNPGTAEFGKCAEDLAYYRDSVIRRGVKPGGRTIWVKNADRSFINPKLGFPTLATPLYPQGQRWG